MTAYRLKDIKPNPFRNIERYPIDRTKVDALKASIERTDFWDNIVARPHGKGAEVAYGHHRLVALNELYTSDHEVNLITRRLDDAAMLHMMADENMQEWAASGPVVIETVRAVRDFLDRDGSAPSRPRGNQHADSVNGAPAIAAFLGWPQGRIERALSIILGEEAGDLKPEDTDGMSLEAAFELGQSVKRIHDPVVKRAAIDRVRTEVTKPKGDAAKLGYRGVREVVAEVRHEARFGSEPRPPVPSEVAERLYRDIEGYWRSSIQVAGQPMTRTQLLRLIAENRNTQELTMSVRPWADQIADALDTMATEAKDLADLLRAEQAVAIGAK